LILVQSDWQRWCTHIDPPVHFDAVWMVYLLKFFSIDSLYPLPVPVALFDFWDPTEPIG